MSRVPGPVEVVRRAGFLARRMMGRGPDAGPPPPPVRERVLVAVGTKGAFEGFPDEARAMLPGHGRLLAAAFAASVRFHVVPAGDLDVLVFAPTNLGDLNRTHVFPYLDEAFDRVSGRAGHAALLEYGTSIMDSPSLALVRASGDPVPGAPSIAMTLAAWRDPVGAHLRMGLVSGDGPLENGYMRSTVLFSMREDPTEARRALDRVARSFSARQTRLVRMPGDVPEECIVLDLAVGLARNDAGDEVGLSDAGPAPAFG
jgi:hypothetical protein